MMQSQTMEQHVRDQMCLSIKTAEVMLTTGYDFWYQTTMMSMRLAAHSLCSAADMVQISTSFFQTLLGMPTQTLIPDHPVSPSIQDNTLKMTHLSDTYHAHSLPVMVDVNGQHDHLSRNDTSVPGVTPHSTRKQDIAAVDPAYGFYFRGPNGWYDLMANTLSSFIQHSDQVDDTTWLYHLQQGDYRNWFRYVIHDDELANEVLQIEQWTEATPADKRRRLQAAIKARYMVGD